MNHEAYLIQLRQLERQIRHEATKLAFAPVKPDSIAFDRARQQGRQWEAQFDRIERDLKSRDSTNQFLLDRTRFGPQAHAARDRFRSIDHTIAELRRALMEVAAALIDFAAALYGGESPIKKALEALKTVVKHQTEAAHAGHGNPFALHGHEQVVTASVRQIVPEGTGMPQTPVGVGIDVLTLIFALLAVLRSGKRKSAPGRPEGVA